MLSTRTGQSRSLQQDSDIRISTSRRMDDEKDGVQKYQSFVNSYNYEREHGGINGMTPAEKFLKCLKQPILIH